MPSTYSTSLRLELMADGEKSGTWGTITNTNLGTLIEQGVAGVASVAHDDSASYTLTTNNGSSDEARNAVVLMTGALTADREVIVPDVDKVYIFKNGTSGGFALTFKTSGGSGVTIPNGRAAICYVDSGTGTVNAIDDGYFTDSIYIEGSSAGDFITAESTNAGATSGPDIKLYRNSASPADGDVLSKITFTANTDNGSGGVSVSDVEYASINVSAPETNETSGEAGKMVIALKRGGTTQNYIEIQGGTSSDADNDSIVFKTGGSAVITIDNSQNVTIANDLTVDTDTLYVDSANDRVYVGTTTAEDFRDEFPALQNHGSGIAGAIASVNSVDADGTSGFITIKQYSSGSVPNNYGLGSLIFAGADGSGTHFAAAEIKGHVDGASGTGDLPGRLVFRTTADGASSTTERMRINSSGHVTIGSGGSEVNNLTVYDSAADSAITIQSADASTAGLVFGDTTDFSRGRIVYDNDDESMAFETNNLSEAMRIDSSQRVLIGGQSDSIAAGGIQALLQVEGTGGDASLSLVRHSASVNTSYFTFGKSRGADATIVQNGDNIGFINFAGADGTDINSYTAYIASQVDGTPGSNDMPGRLTFYTTADGTNTPTERMRINSSGNVGIGGGIDPKRQLVLYDGSSGQVQIQFQNNTTGTTNVDGFGVGLDSSELGFMWNYESSDTYFGNTSYGEIYRLTTAGQLIKGYTSNTPTAGHNASIQIVGQGTADFHDATAAIIGFSNNSNGAYLNFGSGRSDTAGTYTVIANNDTVGQINFCAADGTDMTSRAAHITIQMDGPPGSNDTPGRIMFFTSADGASNPTEQMRIDRDGYIRATTKAFVASSGTLTGFYSSGSGVGIYRDGAYSNCGSHIEIGTDATSGWASMYVNRDWSSGEDERVLQIAVNSSPVGYIKANTSGVTYETTSDRRLKTDIQPLVGGTEKLMAMKPVSHKWIADSEAPAVHGFIAQEMHEIVPEAVSGDPDGEEMMSMDYGRITPVLVAALQDAHNKIAALEERLAEMEAK